MERKLIKVLFNNRWAFPTSTSVMGVFHLNLEFLGSNRSIPSSSDLVVQNENWYLKELRENNCIHLVPLVLFNSTTVVLFKYYRRYFNLSQSMDPLPLPILDGNFKDGFIKRKGIDIKLFEDGDLSVGRGK